nr:putative reverse transcriptase, RNA-dependent DNA polymerase [Tanacetum cinerariifolium]
MNKLVKINFGRGLPSKLFENDQACVTCQKGKQHNASCKSKTENSICLRLHLLHMDLFGPTFVKSLIKKMYCLVVTDDYSRFTWVFFLVTKDVTSGILKSFITRIENLVDHKVKMIRCDNKTEFKNREINKFCKMKGILRQFSVARTPHQNSFGERRNRTLIKAARTMIADSKLPNHLGKFDGKDDEGFFVGYSLNSNAFKVFNSRTRIVENNLHISFSKSTPNVKGSGPDWLFDIDALTKIMNYEQIVAGTQSNGFVGTKVSDNAGQARKETDPVKDYILLSLWTDDPPFSQDPKSSHDDGSKPLSDDGKSSTVNAASTNEENEFPFNQNMPALEDVSIFNFSSDDEDDEEPKKVIHALKGPSWIEAMQKELLQFKLQEVWTLVDLPNRKRAIGTKWVFRNKKDEKGIMIRNKTRLVAQGYIQEEKIAYHEVFDPVARIEVIRLFLAYALFNDFVVYQMDVRSTFLYEKIEEEVYVCQPPGFEYPNFPDRVYKVEIALYGLHQAPRASYEALLTYLLDNGFQRGKINKTLLIKRHKGDILLMSSIGELTLFLGLQVKQKKDGIFISKDKYVAEILKKFRFAEVKNASTPMDTQKPLLKDEDGKEVNVHMYRSMIGSLMYLTSSKNDIMFVVCACARYQVNPKVSHLHAVKRIFRRLSILGCRLISWQCKKQTVVANSTTEAEYVAASS